VRRCKRAPAWTETRCLVALKRFAEEFGEPLPAGTTGYQQIRGGRRDYPSAVTLLRWWPSLIAAWGAAGYKVVPTLWMSADELAILRENVGQLPVAEIARMIGRKPAAVLDWATRHGRDHRVAGIWTLNRIALAFARQCSEPPIWRWVKAAIADGLVRASRNGRDWAIEIADLPRVPRLQWDLASAEIVAAVRQAQDKRRTALLAQGGSQGEGERCTTQS